MTNLIRCHMNQPVLDRSILGGLKVIDVDTHLVEPFDLWSSPAALSTRDRLSPMKMVGGFERKGQILSGNAALVYNVKL